MYDFGFFWSQKSFTGQSQGAIYRVEAIRCADDESVLVVMGDFGGVGDQDETMRLSNRFIQKW